MTILTSRISNLFLRIWRRGNNSISTVGSTTPTVIGISDVSNRKKGRVGVKRVKLDLSQLATVELRKRTNIHSLSVALSLPKSTVQILIKACDIRSHTNALKPSLTDANKMTQLSFCLSMLILTILDDKPTFEGMYDYVHIDEKWFFMSKSVERYYLLSEEADPYRTVKSTSFIEKVMFLAVVGRPRFDLSNNCIFDRKIDIFPFTYKEAVKRSSKNRSAGRMVTKSVSSVTKDMYRACLLEKLLSAIRRSWPRSEGVDHIVIQQDNVKPRIQPTVREFVASSCDDGFAIRLKFQPPNNPDMNVLDLGFFRAIQALQHQEAPKTIDELVAAVEKSFVDFSPIALEYIHLVATMHD